ncbi:acyl--CoA ligase [Streptomyces sp. NBC_01485]|uniref:class I adenylate-forming enzyme family protein n=1 Tax=Streptomyces sp. NBC_01485 TaxID=2903884 RepID=UPI002E370930|nr:class I adenylate-forming enzyme family protein [Streptomyces sp. NBC_01485]
MDEVGTVVLVSDLLRERALRHPETVALNIDGVDGLSYGHWQRRTDRTAHGLLAAGVTRGQRIGLLFDGMDWNDYAVAYLAVLSSGATAVHLSERLGRQEILRRLTECEVRGIIHGEALRPPEGLADWTVTVADLDSGDESPVHVPVGAQDNADILYTSGTTGTAKAFTNPHGNLTFGRGPAGLQQFENPTPLLAPMPLGTTSSATTVAIIAVTSPSALVLAPVDDVERMAELIVGHRTGSVMITPWIATRMLAARLGERHDLRCVERVAIASAPLAPALSRALLELFPAAELNTAYSQSEAVPAVVVNTFDPARPATLGRPAPGSRVRVADESGTELPAGEVGEIQLRSAAPRRRYLDPERDAGALVDGWTRTGDLGSIDQDGYLHLFDRGADVLRVNGELLSSVAVESALYEHPAVSEAALVGVARPDGDDMATAVVVMTDPAALKELPGFLAERLPPSQVPAEILVRDRMPRGITGKPLKRVLREELAELAEKRRDQGPSPRITPTAAQGTSPA